MATGKAKAVARLMGLLEQLDEQELTALRGVAQSMARTKAQKLTPNRWRVDCRRGEAAITRILGAAKLSYDVFGERAAAHHLLHVLQDQVAGDETFVVLEAALRVASPKLLKAVADAATSEREIVDEFLTDQRQRAQTTASASSQRGAA